MTCTAAEGRSLSGCSGGVLFSRLLHSLTGRCSHVPSRTAVIEDAPDISASRSTQPSERIAELVPWLCSDLHLRVCCIIIACTVVMYVCARGAMCASVRYIIHV